MSEREQQVERAEEFLRRFERNSGRVESGEVLKQFGEEFLACGPEGSRAVRREMFAAALPKRQQMFAEMGLRSSELEGMEVTPLDARYTLARTRWRMVFEHGDEMVESTFLLEEASGEMRIVVYLSHRDWGKR